MNMENIRYIPYGWEVYVYLQPFICNMYGTGSIQRKKRYLYRLVVEAEDRRIS